MPSHWSASSKKTWIIAGALIGGGVMFLSVLASVEAHWLKTQPWSRAIWTEDFVIRADDAIETWSRRLSIEQSLGVSPWVRMIQEDLTREDRVRAARLPSTPEATSPLNTEGLLNLDFLPRATLLMINLPAQLSWRHYIES